MLSYKVIFGALNPNLDIAKIYEIDKNEYEYAVYRDVKRFVRNVK